MCSWGAFLGGQTQFLRDKSILAGVKATSVSHEQEYYTLTDDQVTEVRLVLIYIL